MRGSSFSGTPWPAGLIGLAMATALGLAGMAGPSLAQGGLPMRQSDRLGQPQGGLSETRARLAANRILQALSRRDANALYALFSEELKRISSPTMVAKRLEARPAILSFQVLKVQPGFTTTTVDAMVRTSSGERQLLMVLDESGKLEAYHFDSSDRTATKVAQDFMDNLIKGNYVSARSLFSLQMQEEITPAVLQSKWQNLQRRTGNVQKVLRVESAESVSDQKLVLVNTKFTRFTDSLFVILDSNNQIINVDFPNEPAAPAPAP
jgi:hypothetical protein